jgi:hypothetical protein
MQIAKHFFYKKNLHIWEKCSTFAAVFIKKSRFDRIREAILTGFYKDHRHKANNQIL